MNRVVPNHEAMEIPSPLKILGVHVTPFDSYTHIVRCVEAAIRSQQKLFCVAINPEKVYRAQKDPRLASVLKEAQFGICDGIGVALAARMLYGQRIQRCTGVDLFQNLIAAAAKKDWGVFILGASHESNSAACDRLLTLHPGLRIVGRQDGYFESSETIIEQINTSKADLLFVAMGSPRQEYWITEHRHLIEAPFCMGVGGTLDVFSGKVQRAPRLFRKTGTEFLYRLLREPSRIRRQLVLPLFALNILRDVPSRLTSKETY